MVYGQHNTNMAVTLGGHSLHIAVFHIILVYVGETRKKLMHINYGKLSGCQIHWYTQGECISRLERCDQKKVFILDVTSHKKCTIFPQLLKICNNVNYIEGRPFPPFLPPSFIFFVSHIETNLHRHAIAFSPNIVSRFGEKNVNVSPPHHTTSSPPLSIFFNDCK